MEKQRKLALTEEEKSVNIVDVFMYLIAHWKWYFLSILLFGGCFWYFYCKTPFVYSRVAIVMIKRPIRGLRCSCMAPMTLWGRLMWQVKSFSLNRKS